MVGNGIYSGLLGNKTVDRESFGNCGDGGRRSISTMLSLSLARVYILTGRYAQAIDLIERAKKKDDIINSQE